MKIKRRMRRRVMYRARMMRDMRWVDVYEFNINKINKNGR